MTSIGNLFPILNTHLNQHPYTKIIILTDTNVQQHCLPILQANIDKPIDDTIVIPPGEQHKNINTCQYIWNQLFAANADRNSLLINLGGGVISDMGGFCAATFKRGIPFIHIPTTLLSQVDASIGGKLGIDYHDIKNSIGVFANPQAVFIDTHFLQTLSPQEQKSGFAEMLKHALIADAQQWTHLKTIDPTNHSQIAPYLAPSLNIKKHIVEIDPLEKGLRKALNFGHTIGHAIESLSHQTPNPLLHGQAVAYGMIVEAYLSIQGAGLSPASYQEIHSTIHHHYGPYPHPTQSTQQLINLMQQDKKNEGNGINFALLPTIGTVQTNCIISEQHITKALQTILQTPTQHTNNS